MQSAVRPNPVAAMLAISRSSFRSRQTAVFHETGLRMGALLKKSKTGTLEFIEEFVVAHLTMRMGRPNCPPFGNPGLRRPLRLLAGAIALSV